MGPPPRRVDSMPVSIRTEDLESERSSEAGSEVISVAESSSRGRTSSARSKYRDTIMNSINYMIGSAMLSMPYAFAKGGWLTILFSILISAFAAFTAHLLGKLQSDVLRVTPPLGANQSAAGHYVRCMTAKLDGVRRYMLIHTSPQPIFDQHLVGNAEEALQKRFRSDAKKGKAHTHDEDNTAVQGMPLSIADIPKEEVRSFHKSGTWIATWVQSDRRWLLQYEGPRLVEKELEDGEHYTTTINDSPRASAARRERRLSQAEDEKRRLIEPEPQYVRITFDQAPMLDRLVRYPEIALASFGNIGFAVIQLMFTAELYLFMVSWVIVAVQNLKVVVSLSEAELTLIYGCGILIPSMVRDFSRMSFLSFFGLFACLMILGSLIFFGFHTPKSHGPGHGSLLNPANDTDLIVWSTLPLSLSLVMSAFGGHSLMPSIRADMRKPVSFKGVVRWTFVISGIFYTAVGALGYAMFGKTVDDIVNIDFDQKSGVTKFVAVLLVIVQFTKHGLANNALCGFFEDALSAKFCKPGWLVYGPVRLTALVAVVFGSVLIPNFSTVMSLIGASISCTVSLIFPLAAYMRLKWQEMSALAVVVQSVLLFIGVVFAITGTIQAVGITF